MGWCAESPQGQIGTGTIFGVFYAPSATDTGVPRITAGNEINVRLAGDAPLKILVLAVDPQGAEAVVQHSSTVWLMRVIEPEGAAERDATIRWRIIRQM